MEAVVKSILTAIIAGGVLIAAFYLAYLFLLIAVLGAVGGGAYLFFNRGSALRRQDFFD